MLVYIFQAAVYCQHCGEEMCARLQSAGKAPDKVDDESTFDSDDYPKGPYGAGGGEADSPQHCDSCGMFLENPLTSEGYVYVREMAEDRDSASGVICEWLSFYEIEY